MVKANGKDSSGQTILVTGAGGYIGSVLVGELLASGNRVLALDRFFFGEDVLSEHTATDAVKCLRKDLRDIDADDLVGVDAICDLAALSNDPSGDLDPALTSEINHLGRARLASLAKAAGVPRYLLSSSCSIYGAGLDEICAETTPPNPLTTYAEANLAAEQDVLKLAQEDFCVTVLRNATVFGLSPRMRFDLVVNLMTLHAFDTRRITVLGGGRQWRPLVHVRDVSRAFDTLLTAPSKQINGEVFNIVLDNFQVRTLAAIVREVLPFPVDMQIAPDDADKRDYHVTNDKLPERTGFKPSVTIEEGIREIYEALKYGHIENSPKCSTVNWYKHIFEAKKLIESIELEGRIL